MHRRLGSQQQQQPFPLLEPEKALGGGRGRGSRGTATRGNGDNSDGWMAVMVVLLPRAVEEEAAEAEEARQKQGIQRE